MRFNNELALKTIGLKKTYPAFFRKKAVEAVKGIDMEVGPGEVVALLGPNGAGKTTFIKMVCGLLKPTDGDIRIGEYDLYREKRKAMKNISVVLEGDRNLRFRLTAKENIFFFGRLSGADMGYVRNNYGEVLDRFGIADKSKEQARNLSKGQKQKLSLVISYLTRAPLMLLDEPTMGLDVESSRELRDIIRETAEEGRAVVVTTHEMPVAQRIADRVAIINDGRLVTFRPINELLELFRYRKYDIKLRKTDGVKAMLEFDDPDIKIANEDTGYPELELNTDNKERLFNLLDELRDKNVDILEIVRHQPDLEKVFLEIIGSDNEESAAITHDEET
ncbi:MAG: ABC transporter ATP-binding protein [bacterium]|nr:ABC transporter ATP-binding protein [bacterium]